MNRSKLFFCIFLFLFFCLGRSSVFADEVISLTFKQALNQAHEHHVNVELARERVNAALEERNQALSPLSPQLSASASEFRQTRNLEAQGIKLPNQKRLVGPFNTFDARLELTQRLFDASTLSQLDYFNKQINLARATAEKETADAVALVGSLYVDAERDQQSLVFLKELVVRDEQAVKILETQLQSGQGNQVELLEAKSALMQSQEALVTAKSKARTSSAHLAEALNYSADQKIIFPANQKDPPFKVPSDDEITQLVLNHPEITVADKKVSVAEAEQKKSSADYYPKISLAGDYGFSGTVPNNTERTYSFGGRASVPLFDGGLRAAKGRDAKVQKDIAQTEWLDTHRKIQLDVLVAKEDLLKAEASLKAVQAEVNQVSQLYQVALIKSQSGQDSLYQLQMTKTQKALVEDKEHEAKAAVRLAKLNLVYRLGMINQLLGSL